MLDKVIDTELRELPAGPWTAYGNAVYAGTNVVCTVPGAKGDAVARAIAKLPDLMHLLRAANPDVMSARIVELEGEVSELRAEVDDLHVELGHLPDVCE